MYISSIRLKNIRCIDELHIDLLSRSATNDSLLLLGNNGVGKSTILRSIAIGLCDRGAAAGLLADMYGALIREGCDHAQIEIGLTQGKTQHRITTDIHRSGPNFEKISKQPEDFPWGAIFLCGYGPTRVLHGTNTYNEYATADAVYSLFNYGWQLQNPELVVRRRGWRDESAEKLLLTRLATILMMRPTSITLTSKGLAVENVATGKSTYGALADGHRSTLNWVLDLISWTFLSGRKEPSGIVLIDEIENHLHPTWQRHVLRLLSEQFPRVQFIATSHSPLPASGIYERKPQGFRIGTAHVLRIDSTGCLNSEQLPPLVGWTYDQILESSAFDTSSRSALLQRALDAVVAAYSGPRSRNTAAFKRALAHLQRLAPMDAASVDANYRAGELDAEFRALRRRERKSDAPSD